MYVLLNTGGRGFVAKPGRKYSYTKLLRRAQLFQTREQAINNSCPGNEKPMKLDYKILNPKS